MLLTPTYHVFRMYVPHHDAQLIPLTFDSPVYTHGGERLPAISASASRDSTGRVHFSLVNIDSRQSHEIELDVAALDLTAVTGEILTAETLQEHNTFDDPDQVTPTQFDGAELRDGTLHLTLPPFSLVVLETTE